MTSFEQLKETKLMHTQQGYYNSVLQLLFSNAIESQRQRSKLSAGKYGVAIAAK
jgi:hypothetical protein